MNRAARTTCHVLALCALSAAALCGPIARARAQEPEALTLSVRRTFGYSSGSQIQGSFRMEATGPASLVSVTFKIDGAVMGTVTEAPFAIDFDTDAYAPGWHALTAEGQTRDGRTLASAPRRFEFVTAREAFAAVQRIVVPILIVAAAFMLLVVAVQLLAMGGGQKRALPPGAPRRYGLLGGAVCPRCRRPFPLHWWSLSLVLGRFDRCDHCGRWSLVRRAGREALAAAEAEEVRGAPPQAGASSPEQELRRRLDDSRYIDRN